MSPKTINPRMTIVIVFAFLVIVTLFMQPGGTAENATAQLADVAREVSVKPAERVTSPPAKSPNAAWYAAESAESGPDPIVPPGNPQDDGVPVGDPRPVDPNPPPQGPDFPNNN